MSFEVRKSDLLGRIGVIKTKSGAIETPAFFPVINPWKQAVPVEQFAEEFKAQVVMTNAYIVMKRLGDAVGDIHDLLDFRGPVATDSGAYQLLEYGDIDATPEEIALFQEKMNTDIAVILDTPTGRVPGRREAEETVKFTLDAAVRTFKVITREDILWVGPVQGGTYLDLLAKSAEEMSKFPFPMHGLGSPTVLMEKYDFVPLAKMILTVKSILPPERPLHLFGAGHPMLIPFIVALGCDTFDSASYGLFAKDGRYMTPRGTYSIGELRYFPCECPVCTRYTPEEVRRLPSSEVEKLLALHNLHVIYCEVRRVKQAIEDGRLWELLEERARAHPSLAKLMRFVARNADKLEEGTPLVKSRGLFIVDYTSVLRPEVRAYNRRLKEEFKPDFNFLVLLPAPRKKPYVESKAYDELRSRLRGVHIVFYSPVFGPVPEELSRVYPLSQYEGEPPLVGPVLKVAADRVADFVSSEGYRKVLLVVGRGALGRAIEKKLKTLLVKLQALEADWEREPGRVAEEAARFFAGGALPEGY